jgi:twitching motility protein PilT
VILLGEMRDYETINTAVTAAETGHLIFSSLHTIGAANTIDRITDAFPASQQHQISIQLASVLQAVVSQKLIPSVSGEEIPVFEIMVLTPAIRNLIREGKVHQIDGIIYTSSAENMIAMDTSIYNLYAAGKISKHTAITEAVNPEIMAKRLG